MLHFPLQSIRDNFPCALNPATTTMIISGAHHFSDADITMLSDYRDRGFTVALDVLPSSPLLRNS